MAFHSIYTLQSFIDSKNETEINFSKYALMDKADSILIPTASVISDYLQEIKQQTVVLELSPIELQKYQYRPHLMSYDFYGTTDFDFIILMINNMASAKDFNRAELNMLYKQTLVSILNDIYQAERSNIETNRTKLGL